MPTTNETTTNPLLEELKKPFSAQDLTTKQKERRLDLALAKTTWNDALAELRREKTELAKKAAAEKQKEDSDGDCDGDGDGGEENVKEPFHFLELPGEIRNMIYDLSLKDDTALSRSRSRPRPLERVERLSNEYGGSKGKVFVRQYTALVAKRGPIEYPQKQKVRERKLKALLTKHTKRRLYRERKEHTLIVGSVEAFVHVVLQLAPFTRRCEHELHHKDDLVVPINARGNICDDMPMLSLVNREIFYLFYSQTREGLWFKWKIRNMEFFPFLRFLQSLCTGEWPFEIKPNQIHVEFEDKDEGKDSILHTSKFENVKRLIELHWLDGFSLWGCLTGFTDYEEERNPFFDWMYSVRQIVALYRIDRVAWKSRSVQYLQRHESIESDETSTSIFLDLTDAELVETVIDMLCQTTEYHLGYDGNYPAVGRDGKEWEKDVFKVFRYKHTHRKTAGAREHAVVHLIGQYRKRIDKDLRARLGETYGLGEAG